mmetsp:Transcript_1840/g.3775  ORF Transcript_1840/g.3775 Transcript_1840/m.3775 type:complete len:151 (-) Transcript_1840:12-464(-)
MMAARSEIRFMHLFFLMLAAQGLAFPSISTASRMRAPASSATCSRPPQSLPSRFHVSHAYCTEIHLVPKEWIGQDIINPMTRCRRVYTSSRANSCRFQSSDENTAEEGKTLQDIDNNQNITDGGGEYNATDVTINTTKEEEEEEEEGERT